MPITRSSQPTTCTAGVRIESGEPSLLTKGGNAEAGDLGEDKEAQVASVTSPIVLGMALAAHPETYNLPRLRRVDDPEAGIRLVLQVAIIPKANLLQVAMSSESPTESAAIVNAVVDAYLKNASASNNEEKEKRIKQLKKKSRRSRPALESKRAELQRLNDKIGARFDGQRPRNRNLATLDQYRRGEQGPGARRDHRDRDPGQGPATSRLQGHPRTRPMTSRSTQVQDAFYSDPRVASVQAYLDRIEVPLDNVRRLSRRSPNNHHTSTWRARPRTLKSRIAVL